jgi:ethanolamine utilization protein EutA
MITVDQKVLTSVGIDIGTTTSHLIFSKLVLKEDPESRTKKFHVAEREIIYRGRIFFTPLKEGNTEIDIDSLLPILLSEYERAGFKVSDIDTGAVIVTGESARKENAERIVQHLAREGGKFVAAAAGPNFESLISAYGAGAVEYSRKNSCKLIHCDIGGGTSKISVMDKGVVKTLASINVGGRLIAFGEKDNITRLEVAGKMILDQLGLDLNLGDVVTPDQKDRIAEVLASVLMEVLTGQPLSELSESLMMTPKLPAESFQDDPLYSFSGGVAEFIYEKDHQDYKDLGLALSKHLRLLFQSLGLRVIEVSERIRATVIGASEFTLQVSGSTTYMSPETALPMRNLPVVVPDIQKELLSEGHVSSQITAALARHDIIEGDAPVALAFHDPVRTVYEKLKIFSFGLVKALPRTIERGIPILLVFDTDIGNSVGNILFRETGTKNVLSIDEVSLKEGDFIDVGEPVIENLVFPVVVKSLVFNA